MFLGPYDTYLIFNLLTEFILKSHAGKKYFNIKFVKCIQATYIPLFPLPFKRNTDGQSKIKQVS